MRYDLNENCIYISVTELAEYAFQRENPALLTEKYGFVKKTYTAPQPEFDDESGLNPLEKGTALHNNTETDTRTYSIDINSVQTEVPLEKRMMYGEYSLCINGYADSISYNGIIHTVEEIKTAAYFSKDLTPFSNVSHFAQAAIYAYLYSDIYEIPDVNIRLTYIKRNNGEKISFTAPFKRINLTRIFESLISRAYVIITAFADRYRIFPQEAKELPFPYHTIRDGQLEFINTAYKNIKRGGALLVSAPTGIGKTMSALFPAIKAIGAGAVDKIFYLTAKNVTGKAALDALSRITKYAPHLRSVMICAKEMMCPFKKKNAEENRMNCRFCEKTDRITNDFGKTYVSYRERELDALENLLLSTDNVYTVERIIKTADELNVCPYELALDLSESCMVIVCDYNYVIDDNIRFKRYFKNVKSVEKYAFLIDEAHNLPDRARNTYSAVISDDLITELTEIIETYFSGDTELSSNAEELAGAMKSVCALCTDHEYFKTTDEGEITYGFYEAERIPDELIRCAVNMTKVIMRIIREGNDFSELLEKPYRELTKLVFASSFFDDKFKFFASRENEKVKAEVLCIDPSGIISNMLNAAKAQILFSATLSPIEYFKEVTGLINAETLELSSPYERDNLCLIAYDSISTKFNDRKDTAYDCAEVIAETVSSHDGNYIAYFPSYDYMKRVCRIFAEIAPECSIVMQRQSMSYRERERFLALFHDNKRGPVIGFCVLGGMFSEGIDLAGESLIGAIIVGTGMPQLSAERNIMAAYYDEKNEHGRDYAYVCPGMNKVLQAAGRVIRSENDRGVIVLIDDRFGDANMKLMFPPHWRHIKYTGDTASLQAILNDFWSKESSDK